MIETRPQQNGVERTAISVTHLALISRGTVFRWARSIAVGDGEKAMVILWWFWRNKSRYPDGKS